MPAPPVSSSYPVVKIETLPAPTPAPMLAPETATFAVPETNVDPVGNDETPIASAKAE